MDVSITTNRFDANRYEICLMDSSVQRNPLHSIHEAHTDIRTRHNQKPSRNLQLTMRVSNAVRLFVAWLGGGQVVCRPTGTTVSCMYGRSQWSETVDEPLRRMEMHMTSAQSGRRSVRTTDCGSRSAAIRNSATSVCRSSSVPPSALTM